MTDERGHMWEENREFLSVGQLFTSCSTSHTTFCPSRNGQEGKQEAEKNDQGKGKMHIDVFSAPLSMQSSNLSKSRLPSDAHRAFPPELPTPEFLPEAEFDLCLMGGIGWRM